MTEAAGPYRKPKQARAQATWSAILQAATRIIETEGEEAFTTNHVAETAGVSIGTLYQYFPNRNAIAVEIVEQFMAMLRRHPAYRDAVHTQSVLTITSNVVYGAHTGNTPDGRRAGAPFAPGANPMNGRDRHGMLAAGLSVAKLPYPEAQDGISLTSTVIPSGLGRTLDEQAVNLVGLLDAYTASSGYHLNVNVLNRQTLLDAMEHPEDYPQLTIRVSGYAVNFIRLTPEQQRDVISRTFHDSL